MFAACLRAARHSDLLHANWSISGVVAGLAGRLMGTPVVTTLRGTDVNRSMESRLYRYLLRMCYRLSDRVITVGGCIGERAAKAMNVDPAQLDVIPNGVDDSFVRLGRLDVEGPLRIVSVGSLVPVKAVDTLLKGLRRLPPAIDWYCTIVGDGPERVRLESLARRSGLAERLKFAGALPPGRIAGVLADSQVFVLASRAEGRPNSLIEALAAGRVVVASDIPEIAELVVDGRSGLLVPPDDPERLADALQRLHQDPDLMKRLALAARESVRGMDWDVTGRRYARLYAEVLSGASH
jgi:glycosyltransferase involved in cell wall biosynthesis